MPQLCEAEREQRQCTLTAKSLSERSDVHVFAFCKIPRGNAPQATGSHSPSQLIGVCLISPPPLPHVLPPPAVLPVSSLSCPPSASPPPLLSVLIIELWLVPPCFATGRGTRHSTNASSGSSCVSCFLAGCCNVSGLLDGVSRRCQKSIVGVVVACCISSCVQVLV